jgi:hypothetical protein
MFASAQLNWATEKLVLIVWSGPPTFIETDTAISAIVTRATTVAAGHALPINSKTVTPEGYLQTDSVLVPQVPVGPDITHFIMANYVSTWNDGAPLLYVDEAENLPFTPNGLDILITPDWVQHRGWGRV